MIENDSAVMRERVVWVLPVLHPARILRGGWSLEPAQRETLLRVRETLADLDAGKQPRHYLNTTEPPPGSILSPTLSDLHQWRERSDFSWGISVDVECAGKYLRGIGFTAVKTLRPIWVPFRRQGGLPYWPNYQQLYAAVKWCQTLLADPTLLKVLHNGVGFDILYLIREQGFEVVGPFEDTILMAHTHQPEQPRGLQWLATNHCNIPNWKVLSELEEELDK